MQDYNFIIKGAGCAGLSLAYHLHINGKLKNKTLAIVDARTCFKRDKTWSFFKTYPHHFDDCVIKNWNSFYIKTRNRSELFFTDKYPYQTIDSGKFYEKIRTVLSRNKNIKFIKNSNDLKLSSSIIFNSNVDGVFHENKLWQHFKGIEIETQDDIFDNNNITLMDFNEREKKFTHFFYVLPFEKNKALIETTWYSPLNAKIKNYNTQIEDYLSKNLNVERYKTVYQETGAIPLHYPQNKIEQNTIYIGSAGKMTRLCSGYTFLNIQEQSQYIVNHLDKILEIKRFSIPNKYRVLDTIFLKVLKENPAKMPQIFLRFFKNNTDEAIRFLSNKSGLLDDLKIIKNMPALPFLKACF